jgi:hypothetical protein
MSGTLTSHCAENDCTTAGQTRWWIVALVVCIIALLSGRAMADEPQIVRVEEDWVLEVANPEAEQSAPQIITAMSSTNQLADVHALFEMNHRTLPSYYNGGMALQLWSGDTNLDVRVHPNTSLMSQPNETVYYTVRMQLVGGKVEFEVRNGSSSTWNNFGIYDWFKVSAPTTQTQLSLYSPQVSVDNSRVSFAKHRVKRFGILRVRYYTHGGELVSTDSTERMVHVLPAGQ